MWELAEDARRLVPERMTTEYVNFWNDTRFSRERDTGNHLLTHGANAAQAAVLFRDPRLGRLAARYAICLAHCTRWDPSFLSWLPGCRWEHRAFVPSLVMYDCALILDLCGEWFTHRRTSAALPRRRRCRAVAAPKSDAQVERRAGVSGLDLREGVPGRQQPSFS